MSKEENNLSNSSSTNDLMNQLSKKDLKSIFYLFATKPDSRIKVFEKAVFLEYSDITDLNDCVERKLALHNIDAAITSIVIGYKGSDSCEFGTWLEFSEHHWKEPECVEEIVVKWDFIVNIKNQKIPQRHTLLFRVSDDMKPAKLMQLMASGNSDEFDEIDIMSAPAFCRVDFINSQLSRELINVVSEWYSSIKEPALISNSYYWLKKNRHKMAVIIHYFFSLSFSVLWIMILLWMNTNKYEGNISHIILTIWTFIGLYLLTPIGKIGHVFASRLYLKLKKLEGSRVVFQFTSGDTKKNAEIIEENRKRGKSFIKESFWSLSLNIIAGLVSTYLYLNS